MSMNAAQQAGSPGNLQELVNAHRSAGVHFGAGVRNTGSTLQNRDAGAQASFTSVLQEKMDGLKFSAHAANRLKSRNITVTPEVMGKLEKAVSGAAGKGSRDSLILMRDMAFIVNIPNRTVITAMDGESMKENIFTNIDSTVIAD